MEGDGMKLRVTAWVFFKDSAGYVEKTALEILCTSRARSES